MGHESSKQFPQSANKNCRWNGLNCICQNKSHQSKNRQLGKKCHPKNENLIVSAYLSKKSIKMKTFET